MDFFTYPYLDKKAQKQITLLLPEQIEKYYDPFFGNGAIFDYLESNSIVFEKYFLNCQSKQLSNLWNLIINKDDGFYNCLFLLNNILDKTNFREEERNKFLKGFVDYLKKESDISSLAKSLDTLANEINSRIKENTDKLNLNVENISQNSNLNLLNMLSKIQKETETNTFDREEYLKNELVLNFDTAIKAAIYKEVVNTFNYPRANHISPIEYTTIYFYLQMVCYPYKYRYNQTGMFTAPYGGQKYNAITFKKQLDYLSDPKELITNTHIECQDYMSFIHYHLHEMSKNDFILAIPPSKTTLTCYNQQEFNRMEEEKLFNILQKCSAKYMLILDKSNITDMIANDGTVSTKIIYSKYPFENKNENKGKIEKVIIKNY